MFCGTALQSAGTMHGCRQPYSPPGRKKSQNDYLSAIQPRMPSAELTGARSQSFMVCLCASVLAAVMCARHGQRLAK